MRTIAALAVTIAISAAAGAQTFDSPMMPGVGPMLQTCAPMVPGCGPMAPNGGVGTPASFTGLGDLALTGTSPAYFSCVRAYSAATRGTKLCNACPAGTNVGCADLSSDPVTGAVVPATVGGAPCPGASCAVRTIYDSSGSTSCTGPVACDVTIATPANRGTLVASCKGAIPCVVCPAATSYSNAVYPVLAQPLSASTVVERTGSFSSFGAFYSVNNQNVQGFFSGTPSMVGLFANNVSANVAAADSAPHAIQSVINNTSSALNVDGTLTSGLNAGTNGASVAFNICGAGDGNYLTGDFFEQLAVQGAFSAGDMTAAFNNQNSYYGGF